MRSDFKGNHYQKDAILYAAFFYVRHAVPYRNLEEVMTDRSVQVDHTRFSRWTVKYSMDIVKTAQLRK